MDKLLIYIFYFISYLNVINGFNIDTKSILTFNNGKPNSQFGFKAEMVENAQGKWLLVGSPRDNFTDLPVIKSPGNVYKCPINVGAVVQSGCQPITLRSGETSRATNEHPYEQATQLLGFSLVTTNAAVVTCAPSWKYLIHAVQYDREYPIGFCYQIDKNTLSSVTTRYFAVLTQTLYDRAGYIYANSMVGLSATTSVISPYGVILGAPGIVDGIGGLLMYNPGDLGSNFYVPVRGDSDPTVQASFSRRRGSYLGYSTASGRFGPSSLPMIVSGAPHFSNARGHVGTVLIAIFASPTISVQKALEGDVNGAQFGAALAVVDVNNDGLHDLLISSPLDRDQETDEGKVDVYQGTGGNDLVTKVSELRGIRKAFSRFGTCITNLGDITDDNYNDIAIGAPFEEDSVGAVYIFNGSPQGLNTKYSQRITGREVQNGLMSFGWHISSTLDVDNNMYGDFAVGAYMSDTTVILRTKPVAKIAASVTLSAMTIPLNSSGQSCMGIDNKPCVHVQICFTYSGTGVGPGIYLDYEIKVDATRVSQKKVSRMHLFDMDEDKGYKVENKNFQLTSNDICKQYIGRTLVLSKEFYRSIEEDIKFELVFKQSNISAPGQVLPILALDNNNQASATAQFQSECEACRPNLQLNMMIGNSEVIVGETNEIIVIMELKNLGDPSYNTAINITTSNNTAFLNSQILLGSENVVCTVTNSTMGNILCEIGVPFRSSSTVKFSLRLSTTENNLLPSIEDIDDLQPNIVIQSHAMPTAIGSVEADFSDNEKMLQIPVRLKAVPEITGISQPEQKTLSDTTTLLKHNYVVYNNGPSPLPGTSIVFNIPVRTTYGLVFIKEENIAVSSNLVCKIRYPSADEPLPSTTTKTMTTNHVGMTTTSVTMRTTVALNDNVTSANPTSTTPYLTTTISLPPLAANGGTEKNLTCDNYICAVMNCSIPPMPLNGRLQIQLALTITEAEIPNNSTDVLVRYVTKGELQEPDHPLMKPWEKPIQNQIITRFFANIAAAAVTAMSIWVIIGGGVGGIVLFVIFGIILWKCGFFKREKNEEIQKYKRISNLKRRTRLANSRTILDSDDTLSIASYRESGSR